MSAALSLPTVTSILDLADGLHAGIPESVYHARIQGVASKSVLDLIAKAPAVYAGWLTGTEREDTPALFLGKALHSGLLEPDVFRRTYTVEPRFGDCRKTGRTSTEDAKASATKPVSPAASSVCAAR